jgi:formamidase
MGVSGVAPSAEKLKEWTAREQRLLERGGMVLPPDAAAGGACGLAGLRTLPPRENGGNFDVKQMSKGAKLFLPVFAEGLFHRPEVRCAAALSRRHGDAHSPGR